MRRRKIWYRRHLFKHHFRSYKDWDRYNPASDFKHPIRYKSDALICRHGECPRAQMPISEHEAFYYFAKRHFWKRMKLEFIYLLKFGARRQERGGCYVCPFCGGSEMEEFIEKWFVPGPGKRYVKRSGDRAQKRR